MFGFAIAVAFLLVTVLFVILYIASVQRQNSESPGISSPSSGDPSQSSGQPGQEDPFFDPSSDPDAIETPDPPGEYRQGDPDEQTGESTDTPTGTGKVAYLTFDDGPVRETTPAILDILLQEGVKATFFVIPNEDSDDLFRRIIDEGHEIGNHSYSHRYNRLYERSINDFRQDIQRAHDFLIENFDYTMVSFRFPGGIWEAGDGLSARIRTINDLGYRHYQWHIDTNDWRRGQNAEDIIKTVLDNTAGREHVIILMHDNHLGQETVKALPGLIEGLREQGYTFETVKNFPQNKRTGLSANS